MPAPMPDTVLSTLRRDQTADTLESEVFDLVIVGGGISGAGVAREAARRGLRVALLEAEDYASGTSSRSSKLIHGGLRYLAMGEVALVRKTALERKEIFRLAPHLAEKRWMLLPSRSYGTFLKLRTAVTAYEKLGDVDAEDRHQHWKRADLERDEPLLDRETYKYVCAYREYLTDDAHLVLANVRAAAGLGAVVLNHARVDRIITQDGVASGVEAVCGLTGRRLTVRARGVVNAAGPWVEAVQRLEDSSAPPLLHLSKGVHIVLPAERLPVRNMIVLEAEDRRTIFVIRHGACVYVGTTDTSYEPGSDLWPTIDREDVDYLLKPVTNAFSVDPLGLDDIVAAWSGLRPLIAEPGKAPQEISRKDEVLVGPARVVTLAGGKLTGYRPMAREALDCAAEVAGLSLAPDRPDDVPLPGGDFDGDLAALTGELVARAGVPEVAASRLARLYGAEAGAVVSLGVEELVPGASVLASEVEWAVTTEGAATLEDVIYRRLRTALYNPEAREATLGPVADLLASKLGWSEAEQETQVDAVRARLAADLAFQGS
ncbi:glycerol-3-phosphate dehydrogenase/oxidase [Myxococcota bacterium]|nr:glycerol-3-phosphate dehydrogenase/oxidase [Myxococcota bacterium]